MPERYVKQNETFPKSSEWEFGHVLNFTMLYTDTVDTTVFASGYISIIH